MSRRTFVILVVLCAVGAAIGVVVAVREANGSARPGLSRLSNHGVRVHASQAAAHAFRASSIRLLAVRDGRAFYILDTDDGQCFGVGSAETIGDPGGEVCPHFTFPSAPRPTLDFSVYEGQTPDRDAMTLFRIEGFAADGVAAIGVLNRAGHLAWRVPVADNVYVLNRVPQGLSGAVVALDAGGSVISGTNR